MAVDCGGGHDKGDGRWWTIIGITTIGASDIDIYHLGNEVDPGHAQAAHHAHQHHNAPTHKSIPFGQKSW